MKLTLPYQWHPRPYQAPLWKYLSSGGKRAVVRWHRRAGKDDVFLHHVACAAHERIGNYWYMLPEYAQARKSMWDAINPHSGKRRIDEAFPKELRATTRENEMMIVFKNGSTFQLVGSDNFNSLVGSPPLGVVFSEYALSNPSSWAYLMPILEENGGWAAFNSTPRGNNHFKNLCKFADAENDWFYEALTADQTGIFTPEQLQAILRQLQSTHGDDFGKALWLQEYFVSFDAAIPGAIWADCLVKAESEGRITSVPVDPDFPVSTAFDLGRTDDTAIWFFQMIGGDLRIVDYHSSSLKDVPFYAKLLHGKPAEGDSDDVKKIKERTKHFTYSTNWLPHDARPRTLAGGGKSILQQFEDYNASHSGALGRFAITPRLDVQEGIQAARATFPRAHFDKDLCERGLECLRHYHREWDEDKKCFLDHPVHDWSSHGADGFRYLSLVWKHPKSIEPKASLHQRLMAGSVNQQTFGQLKTAFLDRKRAGREEVMH